MLLTTREHMTRILCSIVGLLIVTAAGARNDGFVPIGTVFTTSCVTVKSFDEKLRSSPGLGSKDRYVGYVDFSGGWGSVATFVISPVNVTPGMPVGEVLRQADQRRNKFWAGAQLTAGEHEVGKPFEAYVPPDVKHPSPNVTITKRPAIMVRGHLQEACGKMYLVAVYANPLGTEDSAWRQVRQGYDKLLANTQWPSP
jgi:hypothetical protein